MTGNEKRGGGGLKWEVSQRFTHFPLSIQAETCFADCFQELKLKCHIMKANVELLLSTFTVLILNLIYKNKSYG